MRCSPGVLAYGGDFTIARRDALDALCNGLPVPKPSAIASQQYSSGTVTGTPISSAVFQNAFNNRHGG